MCKKSTFLIILAFLFVTATGGCITISFEKNVEEPIGTQTPSPTQESFSAQPETLQLPDSVDQFLDGARGLNLDSFEPSSEAYWDLGKIGKVSNGMLELIGDEKDINSIGLDRAILAGEGVLFRTRYTHGAQFTIFIQSGAWGKPSFRRVGIDGGGKPKEHIWLGSQFNGDFLSGDFSPKPDSWYYLLMAIDNRANILIAIWDPENSENQNSYKQEMDEESQGQYWGLGMEVFRGTLQVDDFFVISFESIR
jgi:hypothetical protein